MSRNPEKSVSRRKFIVGTSIGIVSLSGCNSSAEDTDSTLTPTPTSTPTTTNEPEAEFKITEIVTGETFTTGDTIEPQVTVENTGEKAGKTVLKFSLEGQSELVEKEIDSDSLGTASTTFEASKLDTGEYEVSVEAGDSIVSKTIEVFDVPNDGFYGRLTAPDDISMSDLSIGLFAEKDGKRDHSHTYASEDGFFTITHGFDTPYRARLSYNDQSIGNFNGLPPVGQLFNGTVSSEQKAIETVERPRAYRTEVRLVDSAGNPVTSLEEIIIREASGHAAPGHGTLTSDGYVKQAGASKTGIPVPEKGSKLEYHVELDPKAEDEWGEKIGTIYGSEEGEQFEFTVENPSQYK